MSVDMFFTFFLREGECLNCDHCTHVIKGSDEKTVAVYFEKTGPTSDSDLMVRCQTCHEILQNVEETQA